MSKKPRRPARSWTESELEYICRFNEYDGYRKVALGIDRPEGSVDKKLRDLKRDGLYEHYKNIRMYWV